MKPGAFGDAVGLLIQEAGHFEATRSESSGPAARVSTENTQQLSTTHDRKRSTADRLTDGWAVHRMGARVVVCLLRRCTDLSQGKESKIISPGLKPTFVGATLRHG